MSQASRDPDWTLGLSEERDIDTLMKWFPNEESVRIWGGPIFRFPFNRHSFAEDVHWRRMTSYSLRNHADGLAAFGQVCSRYERIHFARLVSNPEMRRRGIGKQLLTMLMRVTPQDYDHGEFSLFVFRNNLPALNCYRSLGFEVIDYPADAPMADDCYYLTRPISASQKQEVTRGESNDK